MNIEFTLSYEGNDADDHEIDFYDVAQGLIGFQRSLAITTHLILNNEVITQAPSLKNARIVAVPPEEGSWTITALVIGLGTAVYKAGTAPKDTPLGHLIHSAYDYVISESLGFHVDYDKSLGKQYNELKSSNSDLPILDQSRLDSAVEKCENAVKEMHRPIYANETAKSATITTVFNGRKTELAHDLNIDSYEYIRQNIREQSITELTGRVSMYNINTHKGRIFLLNERRPVPFTLIEGAKTVQNEIKITNSLSTNLRSSFKEGDIKILAYRIVSRTGRLKALLITHLE